MELNAEHISRLREALDDWENGQEDARFYLEGLVFEYEMDEDFRNKKRNRYAGITEKGLHPHLVARADGWGVASSDVLDITPLLEPLGRLNGHYESKYLAGGGFRWELPIELYAHQLMDYDFTDDAQVVEFSVKYGILCLDPNDEYAHFTPEQKGSMKSFLSQAQEMQLLPYMMDNYGMEGIAGALSAHPSLDGYEAFIETASHFALPASLNKTMLMLYPFENVRTSLITAQERFATLFRMLADEMPRDGYEALDFLNYGNISKSVRLELYHQGQRFDVFSLTPSNNFASAICNQFIDTLANPEDWKYCKWCDRPFKRKQPSEGVTKKPRCRSNKKPGTPPIYCCDKCKNDANNERKKQRKEQLNRTNRRR